MEEETLKEEFVDLWLIGNCDFKIAVEVFYAVASDSYIVGIDINGSVDVSHIFCIQNGAYQIIVVLYMNPIA